MIYAAVADADNHAVRLLDWSAGGERPMVKTLVGLNCNPQSGCQKGWRDGGAMYAQINSPKGVRFAPIVDANTNTQRLAISDSGNNRIRFITLSSPLAVTWAGGNVSTVAGSSNAGLAEGVPREGLAEEASFSTPQGLYFTSDAQRLLIADLDNNRIRLLTRTFCPNFRTEGTEECDDGTSLDNDGCSIRCAVESGFQCTSGCRTFCEFMRPSTCVAVCGDARNAASEECDDGNLISGDGCSKYSQVERGWACLPGMGICFLATVARGIAPGSRGGGGGVGRAEWGVVFCAG